MENRQKPIHAPRTFYRPPHRFSFWRRPGGRADPRSCLLPGQGPGRGRGHPRQYAGRLWPGGRPERHRRQPAERPVHPGKPSRPCSSAWASIPAAEDADQGRGRRDGHRQSPRLRRAGHAHRRDGERDGRCQEPVGRHLLVTPLFGADGQIYALAQGPVAMGGFSAQGEAGSVTRGVPTAGRISNGAIVERETGFHLASHEQLRLSLHNPDLTTATRIANAINSYLGGNTALATDPSTVELHVPANYPGGVMGLLTDIEQVKVDPDQPAKVIIDKTSGVIVMGADVRVSTVAIAQGNLTIKVTETPQVSQPSPFSNAGTTQVVPRTHIQIDDGKGNKMAVLHRRRVAAEPGGRLNALGVGPRDIISILQAIKAAGALQAEIQIIG